MSAIVYRVRKEIKNAFLDMFHHPAKLVLYLGLIALLGVSMFTNNHPSRPSTNALMDIRILHGIYLAVLLLIGVPSILVGLKSGATFFKMSDVNFMFVSPISPKTILAYGLVKQMASSLLMMVFLMFYSGMAINMFGISVWQMIALVAGVALMVFTIQLITLLIYSVTSGRPGRVLFVKVCLYGIIGVMAAFVLGSFFLNGSNMESIFAAIASPYIEYVPIIGWIKGMIFAIIAGNTFNIILFASLNVLSIAGSVLMFVKSNSDYYEDVLQTTESTFALRQSMKSGRTAGMNVNSKPSRVTDTGINHGWGANTFFFKHLRQAKRGSRLPFIRTSSVVLLIINIIVIIVVPKLAASDGEVVPTGYLLAISLVVSTYILFFLNAAGDWTLELMKPYIYLVPARPFDKLLWASMTTIMMPVINGVVIFTILGIALHANPATALICILIYASMGFLFTASNVLSQRIFGTMANKGLIMILYMLLLAVLLAPGIGGSVALYIFAKQLPGIVIGLPVFVCNMLISVGIFAACRNLLSTVELSN